MKKKHQMIVIGLFLALFIMVGIFFYVFQMYRSVGLSLVKEFEGEYSYNGKLLLSSATAML